MLPVSELHQKYFWWMDWKYLTYNKDTVPLVCINVQCLISVMAKLAQLMEKSLSL